MLFCRNFIVSFLRHNFLFYVRCGEMKSFPIFVFVLIQLDEGEELCTHSRGEETLLVDDDDDFERQIISIVGMLDGDSKNGTSILCFYVRFVDFIGEEKFNAWRSFVCSHFFPSRLLAFVRISDDDLSPDPTSSLFACKLRWAPKNDLTASLRKKWAAVGYEFFCSYNF